MMDAQKNRIRRLGTKARKIVKYCDRGSNNTQKISPKTMAEKLLEIKEVKFEAQSLLKNKEYYGFTKDIKNILSNVKFCIKMLS